ncbi:alpha/beta hydrolase [Actinomycetes bacterium KLBMP 9759]
MPHSVGGADGVELNAVVEGPDDAPVTVVLAHGWTLDLRTWGPVARSLLRGQSPPRVVRFDLRGHGRSAAVDPATMTIEQLADDMAAVVTALAPTGKLVLAGHSMGGMTIMALAERHPGMLERVGGIALVSTASGGLADATLGLPSRAVTAFRYVEHRMYSTRRWASRRRLGDPRLLRPAMKWLLLGPHAPAEATRITTEAVAACRPITVSGFRPTLNAHDRDAALAAFSDIPTSVLVGTRDRLTPVTYARRISDALPNAELTVFPDAGHMVPVERVAGVAARISALAVGVRQGER